MRRGKRYDRPLGEKIDKLVSFMEPTQPSDTPLLAEIPLPANSDHMEFPCEGQNLKIILKPDGWTAAATRLIIVAGVVYGAWRVRSAHVLDSHPAPRLAWIGSIAGLIAIFPFAYFMLVGQMWFGAGRETLLVRNGRLILRGAVVGFSTDDEFDLQRIQKLRYEPSGAGRLRTTIRFEYRSLPYGFGKNLEEPEAADLVQTLNLLIQRAGQTVRESHA